MGSSLIWSSVLRFCILAVIILGLCIPSSNSSDPSLENDADCIFVGSMFTILPELVTNIITCIFDPRSKLLTPTIRPVNAFCIVKCVLIKSAMLEEDGSVDAIGALEFLASLLPPALKDKAEDLVAGCQETMGLVDLENDEMCLTYLPMLTCAIGDLIKLFGNFAADVLKGKAHFDFFKLLRCPYKIQKDDIDNAEGEGDNEGGDEAAEREPKAKRLKFKNMKVVGLRRNNANTINTFSISDLFDTSHLLTDVLKFSQAASALMRKAHIGTKVKEMYTTNPKFYN